jgi:hypothetical protein
MPMNFSKTRVLNKDVGRYTKVNTGTAQDPVHKSSRLPGTRVESASVPDNPPKGTNAQKGSTRIRKTRVTK